MTKRSFSPLELNHLQKHQYSLSNPDSVGETPVEYLTGHADFFDLDFLVNQSTLIPRLESEKIIELSLNHLTAKQIDHPVIADIGTGSGCLGLTLALKLYQKQTPYTIYLSDLSPEALTVAQKNATRLLPSTVNLFFEKSDLLDQFPHHEFDLILANLPYIPSANLSQLPPSVKDFEPLQALDGGPRGNTLINRLLYQIPNFLSKKGLAILEIDDTHSLSDFSIPSTLSAKLEKDLYGITRFLILHPVS